ncbi:hypothetical protein BJ122_102282 [Rhodopseudomonas faecalis]|uniref:Uncharacterized protein n=1 Tax=Rhodopseudomonas faecalis TaxID=99655 RepID=A0A318TK11_9BRAD|nr:hypothetical protein [Rhodopseudomonas faecalis]PYF05056.1 hypothetical protein BJ122_102282 [Rhodopseudomonas faecalis]
MTDTPRDGELVEVEYKGRWLPAKFAAADSIAASDGGDEVWWLDHFLVLSDDPSEPLTIPEDTQSGSPLPRWRPQRH